MDSVPRKAPAVKLYYYLYTRLEVQQIVKEIAPNPRKFPFSEDKKGTGRAGEKVYIMLFIIPDTKSYPQLEQGFQQPVTAMFQRFAANLPNITKTDSGFFHEMKRRFG